MEHEIITERLHLQPLRDSDIGFMQELARTPEYFKYDSDTAQSGDEVEKECRRFIERAEALPNEGAIRWIIVNGSVRIGEVHVACNWEETHEWEIGWHLLPEYWRRGFATEAVKAVIPYAFPNFTIHRLAAFINAENTRSAALAERAGMIADGRMRECRLVGGVYYDEYVYSILKREVIQTVNAGSEPAPELNKCGKDKTIRD